MQCGALCVTRAHGSDRLGHPERDANSQLVRSSLLPEAGGGDRARTQRHLAQRCPALVAPGTRALVGISRLVVRAGPEQRCGRWGAAVDAGEARSPARPPTAPLPPRGPGPPGPQTGPGPRPSTGDACSGRHTAASRTEPRGCEPCLPHLFSRCPRGLGCDTAPRSPPPPADPPSDTFPFDEEDPVRRPLPRGDAGGRLPPQWGGFPGGPHPPAQSQGLTQGPATPPLTRLPGSPEEEERAASQTPTTDLPPLPVGREVPGLPSAHTWRDSPLSSFQAPGGPDAQPGPGSTLRGGKQAASAPFRADSACARGGGPRRPAQKRPLLAGPDRGPLHKAAFPWRVPSRQPGPSPGAPFVEEREIGSHLGRSQRRRPPRRALMSAGGPARGGEEAETLSAFFSSL